jgi:uncharacterized membrane protein YccC
MVHALSQRIHGLMVGIYVGGVAAKAVPQDVMRITVVSVTKGK